MLRKNKIHLNDGDIKTYCGLRLMNLKYTGNIEKVTCKMCQAFYKQAHPPDWRKQNE